MQKAEDMCMIAYLRRKSYNETEKKKYMECIWTEE